MGETDVVSATVQRLIKKAESIREGERLPIELPAVGSWPKARHLLETEHLYALATALGARRPLLIVGEPGCGKSHSARAFSQILSRRFLSTVIQPLTEYQDLQWTIDHPARLAAAHLAAIVGTKDLQQVDIEHFINPGPLWFAVNYKDACEKSSKKLNGYRPEQYESFQETGRQHSELLANGTVLLLDEVDKCSSDTLNGLLEVLGNNQFVVPALGGHCVRTAEVAPLIVLTSNGESSLPAAVHRRCVRLQLPLPRGNALQERMVELAVAHFWPKASEVSQAQLDVLAEAARQIVQDREAQGQGARVRSGVSEYLDLVRALRAAANEPSEQRKLLDHISEFVCKRAD